MTYQVGPSQSGKHIKLYFILLCLDDSSIYHSTAKLENVLRKALLFMQPIEIIPLSCTISSPVLEDGKAVCGRDILYSPQYTAVAVALGETQNTFMQRVKFCFQQDKKKMSRPFMFEENYERQGDLFTGLCTLSCFSIIDDTETFSTKELQQRQRPKTHKNEAESIRNENNNVNN